MYKPPLWSTPKEVHEYNTTIERYNEVCGAISRYFEAGLNIDVKWIEEYNLLSTFIRNFKKLQYDI